MLDGTALGELALAEVYDPNVSLAVGTGAFVLSGKDANILLSSPVAVGAFTLTGINSSSSTGSYGLWLPDEGLSFTWTPESGL